MTERIAVREGEKGRAGTPVMLECTGKPVVQAVCPRRGELKISHRERRARRNSCEKGMKFFANGETE